VARVSAGENAGGGNTAAAGRDEAASGTKPLSTSRIVQRPVANGEILLRLLEYRHQSYMLLLALSLQADGSQRPVHYHPLAIVDGKVSSRAAAWGANTGPRRPTSAASHGILDVSSGLRRSTVAQRAGAAGIGGGSLSAGTNRSRKSSKKPELVRSYISC
jgi:hypothetical protein